MLSPQLHRTSKLRSNKVEKTWTSSTINDFNPKDSRHLTAYFKLRALCLLSLSLRCCQATPFSLKKLLFRRERSDIRLADDRLVVSSWSLYTESRSTTSSSGFGADRQNIRWIENAAIKRKCEQGVPLRLMPLAKFWEILHQTGKWADGRSSSLDNSEVIIPPISGGYHNEWISGGSQPSRTSAVTDSVHWISFVFVLEWHICKFPAWGDMRQWGGWMTGHSRGLSGGRSQPPPSEKARR